MGRHSAPDADLEEDEAALADTPELAGGPAEAAAETAAVAPVVGPADAPRGRHARSDETAPEPVLGGTRGDLQLLRQNPGLRVRCAAGVLAPFVIYTLVMVLIGRTDVYLIWVWLPTVLAGVLVGLLLDLAHRRLSGRPPDRP